MCPSDGGLSLLKLLGASASLQRHLLEVLQVSIERAIGGGQF